MEYFVESCSYTTVAPYAHQAQEERCYPNNQSGATWYCVRSDDEGVMAFAGLITDRHGAKLCADYVLPDYRGRGLHRMLTMHRLNAARKRNCSWAYVYAVPRSTPIFRHYGFLNISTNQNGMTLLVKPIHTGEDE